MKRATRLIGILLVLSLMMAVPANAATVEPRGSAFFSSYGTWLYKTSSTSFQVWFDVVGAASATLQEIGVSEVEVYRSSDQENWIKIKTFRKSNYYSSMIAEDTFTHTGYITYDIASPGYYYRACVTFYAKSSAGFAERYVYTEIIQM